MKKFYIYLNTIILFFCLLILCLCNKKQESIYDRRLNAAKWLYYESNFKSNKIGCVDNKVVDINICFIEGLIIDTSYIGDTLEIKIFSSFIKNIKCFPYGNPSFINLFGFYPNVDTVVYRAIMNCNLIRTPENDDSISTNWEWMGLYSRPKQKKMFKDFIIKNQDKINSYLKKEAKKRNYIE
ncbi:MAG: hypothetical protein NTZ33_15440 [Bacteroidetes bacterium]|nr:hypothetical protein [Bacteroidota bacterium]